MNKGEKVKIRKVAATLHGLRHQPIPINDYLIFKEMESGNEVLLNLDNYEHLTNSELLSGLINLTHRDIK